MTRAKRPTHAHQALAAKIARALFTHGSGKIADRLVLVNVNGQDLGGWSEGPATDQIARVLAGEGGK